MADLEAMEGIRIDDRSLAAVMEEHSCWLNEDAPNWRSGRADISSKVIENIDFSEMRLKYVRMCGCTFVNCNFEHCNFSYAEIGGTRFEKCNLRSTTFGAHNSSMGCTSFYDCDMTGVDFSYSSADLSITGCIMSNSCFHNVYFDDLWLNNIKIVNGDGICDLIGCTINRCNFKNLDFTKIRFKRCSFKDGDLYRCRNLSQFNIPMACPEEGAFIGYKKLAGGYIATLQIPADAKRSSAFSKKCRCDKAKVIRIETVNGGKAAKGLYPSCYDGNFMYEVGKTVTPKRKFDSNRFHECAAGIHFFMRKEDAINY